MFWIGLVIVVCSIVLLVRRYETRTVLIAAGFLMAVIAGKPMMAFNAFSTRMVFGAIIEPLLSCMGFAYVMKITKCDQHLIHLMAGGISRMRLILVPLTVLVSALINTSITSAAGLSAAVGTILIPLLISAGVHPAMAASAVFAGTFGSMLSPGMQHNAYVAAMAKIDSMTVVKAHAPVTIVCILLAALSLGIMARMLKEDRGYVPQEPMDTLHIKANPIFAFIPLIPIILLLLGSSSLTATYPWLKLKVSHAMLIGSFLGIACTRTSPSKAVTEFFKGAGDVYASVFGIIIAASVFVGGMDATGMVSTLIGYMKSAESVARWAAGIGPFALAVVSGSGEAATLAFNEAVTPHASQFGLTIVNMGSLAVLSGALGRTMSPLTGAAIICAGLGNVNPMELAKRNAPAMVLSVIAATWYLVL